MKKAQTRTVAAAIAAGWESGQAASFRQEGSGRRLAVGTSTVLAAARSRWAGRVDAPRARDAKAPRVEDWG